MSPPPYHAERLRAWPTADALDEMGVTAATAFQSPFWLDAWRRTIGESSSASPVPVLVRAASNEAAFLLPLIAHGGLARRTLAFADLGVSDYNAPLLGPAAPVSPVEAEAAWRAVRAVLPSADVASFLKMPLKIAGRPNPLALLGNATASSLSGNVIEVGDDFEIWRRRGLQRHFRKEQERAWRVFTRAEGARFERVTDLRRAGRIYADLARMQQARMAEVGLPYLLDQPAYHAFYERLIETGLADGSVVLSALIAGDETVAVLFGVATAEGCAMVRIANAGGAWSTCSPGRLLIEKTMAHLHGRGVRTFDFTIGDYEYKRRFKAVSEPLVEATFALSALGLPRVFGLKAKAFIKCRPGLARAARKIVNRARMFAARRDQGADSAAAT